ncbi:MAG: prephenate dehydrogenase/arogenate dehydrogenase family protein [Gammaproteobacteria bacterium]|nr:prephenate dehydrogenase/arogenate dehydrogenase family protein [Gammaproteobacteria bacterium]
MKLAVVGTGLIGASFAKAARHRGLSSEIVGLDAEAEHAAAALRLGLIDRVVDAVPRDAAAVLLAVPVDGIADWVRRLADHPGTLFDVGSVKAPIIDSLRARDSALPPRYVPCHPIAGSERSGPEAADGDLFAGRQTVLTPVPETDPAAIDQVRALWRGVGADAQLMSAADHDRIMAVTSHLPHLLAFAYLEQVEAGHLPHTGGGFDDFTRIGTAAPNLWTSILGLNRGPLTAALAAFKDSLDRFERALANDDREALEALIDAAGGRLTRDQKKQ